MASIFWKWCIRANHERPIRDDVFAKKLQAIPNKPEIRQRRLAPPPHSMLSATDVMKMLIPKSRATIPAAAEEVTSSAVLVMNQV